MIALVSARLQELRNIPPEVLSLPSYLQPPRAPHQLPTPIVPLMTAYPMALEAHLVRSGMNARGIASPVVPVGEERLRICLHADHTLQDVERLVDLAIDWAIKTAEKIPTGTLLSKL
jgi:8-amino-7-oxononanoate synthase